ncbi:MAG: helix-turn-helix transcriptional regulator [Fretibacterium sp.]|nr:helix-turn-helix transcriptional regulator [Fretibacterium sp.]
MFNVKSLMRQIKSYRKSHGIRQVEFAKRIGVSAPTLSRWEHESGNCNPTLKQLLSIADIFGVTLVELLSQENVSIPVSTPEAPSGKPGRAVRRTRKTSQTKSKSAAKASSKAAPTRGARAKDAGAPEPSARKGRRALVKKTGKVPTATASDTGETPKRKRGRPRKETQK